MKRVVLYPQRSGELNIEPLGLDISMQVPTNQRDFFGRRMYRNAVKRVVAGKRKITVKPLLRMGVQKIFAGAVGDFDFEVTASKKELKAAESLQAVVKVSGKGNLQLLKLPTLELPSALEVFDPEKKTN